MRIITHCIFANSGNGKHFTWYLLKVLMLVPILLLAACPAPEPGPRINLPELSAPSAITTLILAPDTDHIVASWEEPANGGREITAYHLRHSSDGETTWTEITSDIGTHTSYTITQLTHEINYRVQVRAVNDIGNGHWSESATGELVMAVPAAPAILVILGNGRLTVKWEAPYDGGSDIDRYELRYATTGSPFPEEPQVSGIGGTEYTIGDGQGESLTAGASYDVQVRAVNGIGDSTWSEPATAILPIVATKVPAGTAVSAILSNDIDTRIADENLIVSLATGTYAVDGMSGAITVTAVPAPAGVSIPTVNASTGIVEVAADTAAGTYVVYGENASGEMKFAEHFFVTEMPQTNAELKTAVTEGIDTWGNTADLNYIVATAITDMSNIFKNARAFNGDISGWTVSSVTDMSGMFRNATAFNGDISNWVVSSVTTMSYMFSDARAFNSDISNWDVSRVTRMYEMFREAHAFTGDISSWVVGSVTNMIGMFSGAGSFNGNISNWDVSSVTTMSYMFSDANAFTRDLNGWDVSSVTDMNLMFWNAGSFNGDISDWDVSSVTTMSFMFRNADAFNGNISSWNVGSVTDMSYMFYDAHAFTQNLEEWKDHWTSETGNKLDANGKYTGTKTNMFTSSGLDVDTDTMTDGKQPNFPTWY
ncbi:MAG: BspA family leucine-rich repeat surface protein [Salinispira sp.]